MTFEFLSVEDVLDLHAGQLERFRGATGVRDVGLLESAVAQPQAMFGGEFLHADLFAMAAAYLFHLVSNHPFMDGNKRTGLLAALVFLKARRQARSTRTRAWPPTCPVLPPRKLPRKLRRSSSTSKASSRGASCRRPSA